MTEATRIEWADSTFNPWEGCQKTGSPGCDHCYAETRNARFGGGVAVNWGPHAPRRRTSVTNWRQPIAWNAGADAFEREHGRRRRVFCASLADVFDNAVDPAWREDLFDLIAKTPRLDWLLLTKRVGNVANMLPVPFDFQRHYPNVWLGITVVNQAEADRDIPKLLKLDASVRFLSMEPLLGLVDLVPHLYDIHLERGAHPVNWVIVGGESGPGARPMHPGWVRNLRKQCAAAGVPFLFKQHGEWTEATLENVDAAKAHRFVELDGADSTNWTIDRHGPHTAHMVHIGKKAAGRLLDGVEHNGFPEAACAS